MKKYFVLIGLLFMFSFVVAGNSCTPDSGYTVCWENTNDNWLPAKSYAKAQMSYTDEAIGAGYWNQGYAINSVTINYKCSGDDCYLYENSPKWRDTVDCTSSGCPSPFKSVSNVGSKTIANVGDMVPSSYCNSVKAWDYDSDSGYWCWSDAGYRQCLPNTQIKVVNCYKDQDCNSNQFCDTSDDWKLWSCKIKECELGAEQCEGSNYFKCENYKWENEGIVTGKCDVECTSNLECGSQQSNLFCSGNKLMIRKVIHTCEDNKCEVTVQNVIDRVCSYQCRTNKCVDRPPQTCGNNIVEGTEDCESDADCMSISGDSSFECNECSCVEKPQLTIIEMILQPFNNFISWIKGLLN